MDQHIQSAGVLPEQLVGGLHHSIWQVEDGKAKDLLRGLQSPALSHPLLQTSLGRCLFAKLLEQDGQRALLRLPRSPAQGHRGEADQGDGFQRTIRNHGPSLGSPDARQEPDGPFNDAFGGEWLPSLLAPFLYFARLSEAHHGPTRTKGAFTTTRHLIRWLDETGRLSDEERDWVMEALAEHG